MSTWFRRNWKRVGKVMFFGIIAIFGSFLGLFQVVQDFLAFRLGNAQFSVPQLVLVGIGIAGLVIVLLDAKGKAPSKSDAPDPRYSRQDLFEARINKRQFEVGEAIFFTARFKGRLRYGYYFAPIGRPDGIWISGWDIQTLPHPTHEGKGTLRGEVNNPEHVWSWPISLDSPPGEYLAYIRVHDHYPLDWWTALRAWYLRNLTGLRPGGQKKDRALIAKPHRPVVAEKSVSFTVRKSRHLS